MLETLHAPDEVWLNDEIKHDLLDTYCLLKYYRDEALAVNYRIEGEKLVLKTGHVMQTRTPGNRKVNLKKEIWDKRRRAADKKASERILASVRTVKAGNDAVVPPPVRIGWPVLHSGADPAWRCRFSDLANPPCTPGVLDACCLPVRTGLR